MENSTIHHDMNVKVGVMQALMGSNIVTKDQLQVAVNELKAMQNSGKKGSGVDIISVIIKMGFATESSLQEVLAKKVQPEIDLNKVNFSKITVKKIPREIASQYKLIAVEEKQDVVVVAFSDQPNLPVLDMVRRFFENKEISVCLAKQDAITSAIANQYQHALLISDIIEELDSADQKNTKINTDDSSSPIVRLVDAIIVDAVRGGGSDVHMEPDEFFIRVRVRIDGVLLNRVNIHKKYWLSMLGRLKISGGLNIAETRKPQDGAITMSVDGKRIDLRVSSIPTVNGENIVLRILDCSKSIVALSKLGFSDNSTALTKLSMKKPEGIVIITGPTGSGKTTTLYSIIDSVNSPKINIMTLEDPVEYSLPLIRQTQINHKAGLDFASGLRSILRQDPDIIFVGEIRDLETADIAVKSSITGHKVLSTLHTNDAMGAIYRLIDIGIKPFLVATSLSAVIAQRLMRKLCPSCKVPYQANSETLDTINKIYRSNHKELVLYKSTGCPMCMQLGYKGRIAALEVLHVNADVSQAIAEGAKMEEVNRAARANRFIPMALDGLEKVLQGVTSLQELAGNVDVTEYFGDKDG